MAVKKKFVVKVLGYGELQQHEISIGTFNELDDFLLCSVDATACYRVTAAGTRDVITPETFSQLMDLASPIVHVSKVDDGSAGAPSWGFAARPLPPRPAFIDNLQFTRDESAGWRPSLKWELPADLSTVQHYLVVVTEEPRGSPEKEVARCEVMPPGGGRPDLVHGIKEQLTESTHRAEVHAVSVDGITLESNLVRFVVEHYTRPRAAGAGWAAGAQKLVPELCSFAQAKKSGGPTFVVFGKQHHGKSSVINHFNRCLRGNLDLPDVVRSAPAGELETTKATDKLEVPLPGKSCPPVWFLDVPAFTVMDEARKRDLRNLLWNASHNVARGQGGRVLPSEPDGVIVVVSLLALRGEPAKVKEYLRLMQEALQKFPFVVAATHRDTFLIEVGNERLDPVEELKKALQDLRRMANTSQVFAIANYHQQSWWSSATDDASVELMRQLMNNAMRRTAMEEEACAVVASKAVDACAVVVGLLVLLIIIGAVGGLARRQMM